MSCFDLIIANELEKRCKLCIYYNDDYKDWCICKHHNKRLVREHFMFALSPVGNCKGFEEDIERKVMSKGW